MFLSLRDGKAGLGSDHLYLYRGATGRWEFAGTPLTGLESNPYVHGWDARGGRLHVTWVYRGFVWYEGWDDPGDTRHKAQAGPNGPENNRDLCYAYSEVGDGGGGGGCRTWRNGEGRVLADLGRGETVDNEAEGIVAVRVPAGCGLMNQESQAVDWDGGVHVLNRDTLDGGRYLWKHHYRSPSGMGLVRISLCLRWVYRPATNVSLPGTWTSRAVRPIDGARRGRLAVTRDGDLLILLPGTTTPTMSILKATKAGGYASYEEVWVGNGLSGEPLVDGPRLEQEDILSVFVMRDVDNSEGQRVVAILDFQL